eukprot:gb/GFBE01001904.1/.p1 GENE.gb/GFBE01001904.1/~~gb/GFBE01001904.1/.p1  ORF type:complete len:566 (+),score=112.49 gb/GFBE01001904.1/:1-1698(+)
MDLGASAKVKNKAGKSPTDLAHDFGFEDMIDLFRGREQFDTVRGGNGNAYVEACNDLRVVRRVEWHTIPLPGMVGNIGGEHSLLAVFVRGEIDGDTCAYTIEKARARTKANGADEDFCKHGVFVSHWREVAPNMTSPPLHLLEEHELQSSDLTIAKLRQIAVDMGPYNVAKSNCHHAAMMLYNTCAAADYQLAAMPNQLLTSTAFLLSLAGVDVANVGSAGSTTASGSTSELASTVDMATKAVLGWDQDELELALFDVVYREQAERRKSGVPWSDEERGDLQRIVADRIIGNHHGSLPRYTAPWAIFLAGGPGSGKGFAFDELVKKFLGEDTFVHIEVDKNREYLPAWDADKNFPKLQATVDATQVEAGLLAQTAALACSMRGHCFVFDATFRNLDWNLHFIRRLRAVSSTLQVGVVLVDTDVAICKARALDRAAKVGRPVPEDQVALYNEQARESARAAWEQKAVDFFVDISNNDEPRFHGDAVVTLTELREGLVELTSQEAQQSEAAQRDSGQPGQTLGAASRPESFVSSERFFNLFGACSHVHDYVDDDFMPGPGVLGDEGL